MYSCTRNSNSRLLCIHISDDIRNTHVNLRKSSFILVPPYETLSDTLCQQCLFDFAALAENLDVDKVLKVRSSEHEKENASICFRWPSWMLDSVMPFRSM